MSHKLPPDWERCPLCGVEGHESDMEWHLCPEFKDKKLDKAIEFLQKWLKKESLNERRKTKKQK